METLCQPATLCVTGETEARFPEGVGVKFAHEQHVSCITTARLIQGKSMNDLHSPRFNLIQFLPWETDMKTSFLAVCGTGAVVLLSAFAGTRTSPKLQPDTLARIEAITSYCGTADPSARPLYLSKLADLTRGYPAQEMAADRNSSQYRLAAMEANETLAKASHRAGIRGCSEFLAEK